MTIHLLGIFLVLALAVGWDLRQRKIPNAITMPAAVGGVAFHLATTGLPGLTSSALGLAVGLGIFFIPYLLGWLGGGDVKLLAALGAWLGPEGILFASLYSALAGGLLALGALVVSGQEGPKFAKTIYEDVVYFISFGERLSLAARGKGRIPYSLAIAAGTTGFILLGAPI